MPKELESLPTVRLLIIQALLCDIHRFFFFVISTTICKHLFIMHLGLFAFSHNLLCCKSSIKCLISYLTLFRLVCVNETQGIELNCNRPQLQLLMLVNLAYVCLSFQYLFMVVWHFFECCSAFRFHFVCSSLFLLRFQLTSLWLELFFHIHESSKLIS